MDKAPARTATLGDAAQVTVRMLIASYFMATALGSIPGADTAALLSSFVPHPIDRIVGGSIVFTLAFLVLLGRHTRVAALLLGLMTFYASYLHMVQIGIEHVLGAFWRDMALIAALLLTYGAPASGTRAGPERRLAIRRIARTAERAQQLGIGDVPVMVETQDPGVRTARR